MKAPAILKPIPWVKSKEGVIANLSCSSISALKFRHTDWKEKKKGIFCFWGFKNKFMHNHINKKMMNTACKYIFFRENLSIKSILGAWNAKLYIARCNAL